MGLAATAGSLPPIVRLSPEFSVPVGTNAIRFGFEKLSTMSDVFQWYRCTRLRFRLYPYPGSVVGDGIRAVGFAAGDPITPPGDETAVFQQPWVGETMLLYSGGFVYPVVTKWCSVPKCYLLTAQALKWWRTRASGSVDNQFDFQGIIGVATGGVASANVALDIEYTFEFRDFVAAANTPAIPRPSQGVAPDDDTKSDIVQVDHPSWDAARASSRRPGSSDVPTNRNTARAGSRRSGFVDESCFSEAGTPDPAPDTERSVVRNNLRHRPP